MNSYTNESSTHITLFLLFKTYAISHRHILASTWGNPMRHATCPNTTRHDPARPSTHSHSLRDTVHEHR